MTEEKLTRGEKATLLALVDAKHVDAFNEEFYNLMKKTPPLELEEINDHIRRSIVKFINTMVDDEGVAEAVSSDKPLFLLRGMVTVSWLHGYMVAQKWKKSILRNPKTPRGRE